MIKIDVHIGTRKTGTTSIQHYCKSVREELLKAGTLYPKSLGLPSNNRLATAFQNADKVDGLRRKASVLSPEAVESYRKNLLTEFSNEVEKTHPDRMLISNEQLSSRLIEVEEIKRLHDFLCLFSNTNSIRIYLRRQDDLLVSLYSTQVRHGRTTPFSIPPQGEEAADFHYDALLEKWSRVFGRENIFVRIYDEKLLKDNDIVSDFCEFLDIALKDQTHNHLRNPSLSYIALEFLRRFNRHVPPFLNNKPNEIRGDIVKILNTIDPSDGPLPVNPEGLEQFFLRFKSGNDAVARIYLNRDAGLFEERALSILLKIKELTQEEMFKMFCEIWSIKQQQ